MIAAWKVDLNRILHVFNVRLDIVTWISLIVPFQTELVMNITMTVSSIHNNVLKIQEEISGPVRSATVRYIQPISSIGMLTVA